MGGSLVAPKARIARGIHNLREQHSPAIRANIALASLAVQDADVIIRNTALACLASPLRSSIGCRLVLDADEAVLALAVDAECHGVACVANKVNEKRFIAHIHVRLCDCVFMRARAASRVSGKRAAGTQLPPPTSTPVVQSVAAWVRGLAGRALQTEPNCQ